MWFEMSVSQNSNMGLRLKALQASLKVIIATCNKLKTKTNYSVFSKENNMFLIYLTHGSFVKPTSHFSCKETRRCKQ